MGNDYSFGEWQIESDLFCWIFSHLPNGSVLLEFGSGWTSGQLSRLYKVFSVEHNEGWLGKYNTNYIYAPYNGGGWYNREILMKELPKSYDMVLIDGPDGTSRKSLLQNTDLLDLTKPYVIDDMQEDYIKTSAIEFADNFVKRPYEIIQGRSKSFMVIP